jgi:Domain of unknown function (DUF4280)
VWELLLFLLGVLASWRSLLVAGLFFGSLPAGVRHPFGGHAIDTRDSAVNFGRGRSMPKLVVKGAQLSCSMGNAPSQLTVLPTNMVNGDSAPAANIQDMIPNVNILPFGACMSIANPQVAAATSAAMGVLTPQPCIPMTTAPWTPGSTSVTIAGQPAVSDSCQLLCQWAGQIQVTDAGQTDIEVD